MYTHARSAGHSIFILQDGGLNIHVGDPQETPQSYKSIHVGDPQETPQKLSLIHTYKFFSLDFLVVVVFVGIHYKDKQLSLHH